MNSASSTPLAELSSVTQLSSAQIKQAITKGALWLTRHDHTQRLRRIKKKLSEGDTLHFYYDEAILSQLPPPAQLIADLQDYSVWYKPYGMLSQGSKWSDHCTISRWAQNNLPNERPVFIVHRLDRAATGLILVAHSKKAAKALSAMFEVHAFEKHYQIIVHGDHGQRPQPDVITLEIDGKRAKSTFCFNQYDSVAHLSLIDVKIETGRKHQIRKHASSINLPVVGDRLHGDTTKTYADVLNLQLCAVSLAFTCPLSATEQHFELPEELKPQIAKTIKLLDK